ncbi:GNAT family N-acetyltransferase [Nocardioides sp. JQ2195]|uniref:GNAT family N-acetyltransferase n=1 Tax=Nocardioides sp. JQ2195 TaxID=2592334 RepID=UPI001F0FF7F6|nr:GNAT family N-acetyltransferase [Nocardioides sp. JQ2195]
MQEAQANPGIEIPPLHESLADVVASLETWTTHVVRHHGRLLASCRGRLDGTTWDIGRLMVAPDLQGRGLGRWILQHAESLAPGQATSYSLFTGARSTENLRMYKKAGYRNTGAVDGVPGAVLLTKRRIF